MTDESLRHFTNELAQDLCALRAETDDAHICAVACDNCQADAQKLADGAAIMATPAVDALSRARVLGYNWRGVPGNWVAPMYQCPCCGGSLSWEESVDVFDRPLIAGHCRPCHFGVAINLFVSAPTGGNDAAK